MKILILASGGDAPGMNKFIAKLYRAFKSEIFACKAGFKGLISGDIRPLSSFEPLKYENQAGCCIFSSRCLEFQTDKGFKKGLKNCKQFDCVIIMGGNGSYKGAKQLSENGVNSVFIPCTIDNDVDISDYSIGFHTAIKAVCDYVKNTMPSMQAFLRCAVFEVMGRRDGSIARASGAAVEADYIVSEEKDLDFKKIARIAKENFKNERSSCIILRENIMPLKDFVTTLQKETGSVEIKGSIVGHLQRGATPSKMELRQACKFASCAIKALKSNYKSCACRFLNGKIQLLNI